MKHLKIYEKFQKKLTIDILSLCEIYGSMHKAIDLLLNLKDNCVFYELEYRGDVYHNGEFSKYKTNMLEQINVLGNTMMSYGYIKMHENLLNVTFTFFDVDVDDNFIYQINAKKYNL
jgi:hypothetical protein